MNKFYVALLLIFAADVLEAQSPGGVSTNLSLWLKADNTSTLSPTTGSLNSWTYSNSANQFTATVGTQPTVAPNTFNFLPSINFSGSQLMVGPTGPGATGAPIPAGSLAYSVFAVWSSPQAVGGGNMRIWAQRPNSNAGDNNFDGASLFVYPSAPSQGAPFFVNIPTYGDQPEITPYVTGVSTAPAYNVGILTYAPNTPYISEVNLLNQNTNDLELMDQTNFGTGPGVTSTDPANNATVDRVLVDAANLLGARSTVAGDEQFNGNLAELIVYSSNVSAAQRSAIFSYLSLKYGIPLNGNYVSSGGTTIWDAVANGSYGLGSMNYNHFVFGLGMDNASGLSTTQSNSLSTGSGNGTGQSAAGNIVLANPASLADQGFLLVGSNNAGFAETTTNMTTLATAGSERLTTQWLVQNNGTVGPVDLSFDFTGIATTGTIGTSSEFRLDVDNDGDGDFTTGTQELYEPASWNGNVATFSQVTLTANSKVVMTILSNAAPGTPLPVNWVNFTAKANGPDVDLNWTVSANENAKVYDVQHSTDGTSFTTIGEVSNQADVQSYGFVHANAGPGTHYYRILETDQDGKFIYSKILSVNMSGSDFAIRLLNNPVVGNNIDAEVELTAASGGNASLEIWNLSGARVATLMQSIPDGTSRIRLPMSTLPSGTYAVKIRVNDVTRVVQVVKL
jgi:hypothetical protein